MAADTTIFGRLLTLLGVRHTAVYSDARFRDMPFKTLFGMSTLLKEYGVESKGYQIADKARITMLPVPFVAPVRNRMVIVTGVEGDTLTYRSEGVGESIPLKDFLTAWSGVAFVATPGPDACEPLYGRHRLAEVMASLRDAGLWIVGLVLAVWLFVTRGDLHNWGTIAVAGLYVCGLWLSYMLVQKTLGVKSKHAAAVCNVLEPGGCDRIAKSDASTFFGIFHWSEVGLTYFGVGLSVLLIYPEMTGWLAAINVLALPYTLWSIGYQKFVAKTWCTMCVGVQLILWLQFVVFLCSGWLGRVFPLNIDAFALAGVYVVVMLALNRLDAFINARKPADD